MSENLFSIWDGSDEAYTNFHIWTANDNGSFCVNIHCGDDDIITARAAFTAYIAERIDHEGREFSAELMELDCVIGRYSDGAIVWSSRRWDGSLIDKVA